MKNKKLVLAVILFSPLPIGLIYAALDGCTLALMALALVPAYGVLWGATTLLETFFPN